MAALLLFTRQGCCLCDGLKERLLALDPPPSLERIDVDTDPALQARYGLTVPVLAVPPPEGSPPGRWRDLPRVSPRLEGPQLQAWLARQGVA
jgi:hypothetical protein